MTSGSTPAETKAFLAFLHVSQAFNPKKRMTISLLREVERAAGIEPASLAWKAKVLPLHNARAVDYHLCHSISGVKVGPAIALGEE